MTINENGPEERKVPDERDDDSEPLAENPIAEAMRDHIRQYENGEWSSDDENE